MRPIRLSLVRSVTATSALFLASCSTGPAAGVDGGADGPIFMRGDAGTDAASKDGGPEAATHDATADGSRDTGVDAPVAVHDTGVDAVVEAGSHESGPAEASANETGTGDGGPKEGSVVETGSSESGPLEASSLDAPHGDAAPSDAAASDTGVGTSDADFGDGGCVLSGGPTVVATGTAGSYLLRGMVVGPTSASAGEVLIVGDTITCVAASCATTAGASTATIIQTNGIIMPGLIDTHNHILFDVFDETDWAPTKVYTNHNQWPAEPKYSAMVDAKQYLNGEDGSPWDYGCEMDKFGELKGLVAGTTSILGAANPDNRACYGSLARTIDQSPNQLPSDKVQVATLFPSASSASGVCTNVTSGKTDAYLIHIAEGTDSTAHAEFAKLENVTTPAMCLFAPDTTIVHGTALVDADFATMATAEMSLTWSPRSNVFLYGGGTDFTKTTDIQTALSHGLNISIAPDWSMGGSQNLLDELRFAHQVDVANWGGILSTQQLFNMVTANPAKALGLGSTLGSLAAGYRADVMVLSGNTLAPYDALLAATPREVRLVFVDGVPLYGDASLQPIAPVPAGASACETLDACCGAKFACVSRPSKTTGDKLDQTFRLIEDSLQQAFLDYDAMNLTAYKFAPLTPLIRCAP